MLCHKEVMHLVRLQKYMADCGVASRRKCEAMIEQGVVRVNGRPVLRMGTKVSPDTDIVTVRGERIGQSRRHRYIVYYKPSLMVTTLQDEKGRPCVGDFLKKFPQRLYPVGRLDFLSEGLLLITDDGDFANSVMHPRYGLAKDYYAVVDGPLSTVQADQLRSGVLLDGRKTAKAQLRILEQGESRACVRIQICEGRNRQVRRMFETIGLNVVFLKRERVGNISIKDMKPGEWRDLTPKELREFQALLKNSK